jgi:TusA-related sulfurtransferase
MELIARLKEAEIGDVLELLSSDKGSAADVPEWVGKVGHEMLGSEERNGVWHIRVRKVK